MTLDTPPPDTPANDDTWICPSCGGHASSAFCPACGEKRLKGHGLTLRHLIEESAEFLFHYDGRLLRTARALVTAPGLATHDFLRGRRRPYVSPIHIFFIANIVFLLMQTLSGLAVFTMPLATHFEQSLYGGFAHRLVDHHLAGRGTSLTAYSLEFDHAQNLHAKSLILLMVPPFALEGALLFWGRRKGAAAHLVFALHFFAFLMLFLTVLFPVLAILLRVLLILHGPDLLMMHGPDLHYLDVVITALEGIVLLVYLAKATAAVYQTDPLRSWISAAILTASLWYILVGYRVVLLIVTVWLT
jgi:hypothetical protein